MVQCQPGLCGTVSKKDGNFWVALGWSGDVQVVADQVAVAPKAQAVLLGGVATADVLVGGDQVAAARKAQAVLLGGADPEDVLVVGDQVAAAQGAMVALVRQSGYQWWLVMEAMVAVRVRHSG